MEYAIAENLKFDGRGHKYPQPHTCRKCKGFDGNCTSYPHDEWPMIWLTNQCDKYDPIDGSEMKLS